MKATTLSPQKVVVYTLSSIPPHATHLVLLLNHEIQTMQNLAKLTHLTTGYAFNHPVDDLPPTLTHLTTGDSFDQPVDKLPLTLTHLNWKLFQ
jgi:hypothetical protein